MEDTFAKTQDLNDIRDLGVFDLRPGHVSNGNEHAMLRRRRSFSIVLHVTGRRRGNVNANIKDYLEQLCTAVLKTGSTTRNEVEGC